MVTLAPDLIAQHLAELKRQHRDLDTEIQLRHARFDPDQLELQRMKKRKLRLKDEIQRLESALIPDEPA